MLETIVSIKDELGELTVETSIKNYEEYSNHYGILNTKIEGALEECSRINFRETLINRD